MTAVRPLLMMVTGLQGTGKSTLAEEGATVLGALVLAHDWAMSGLRAYPPLEEALDLMGPSARRDVGWSILCALARAQLRHGRSVVLDGMAGETDVARCRAVAGDEGVRFALVLTECADPGVHRSRIEGRQRGIPDWYEVDWDHVLRSRARWVPPSGADLVLAATEPLDVNRARLSDLLGS